MDSGRVRQRSRFTRKNRSYDAQWTFSDFQLGVFQSFLVHKLSNGADAFNIDLPVGAGDGMQNVSAKISEGKYSHSYDGVMYWKVNCTLEVESIAIYTEEELDDFIAAGGLVVPGLDIEWPFGTTVPWLLTMIRDQTGTLITDLAGWKVEFSCNGIEKSSEDIDGILLAGPTAYWTLSPAETSAFEIANPYDWSILITSPTDEVTLLMHGTLTLTPIP